MRLLPVLLATVIVWAAGAPVHASQDALQGRIVTTVEFVVDGRPAADSELAGLVDLQSGAALDLARTRASIEHLSHLRRFSSIEVHAEPDGAGVRVRFELRSAQRIGDVRIEGALGLDHGTLARVARERLGSAAPVSSAPEALSAIQEALGARGYLQPQLGTRLDAEGSSAPVTLVVTGGSGPRWTLGRVSLTGLNGDEAAHAREALQLATGAPYDVIEIESRVQRYTEDLRSSGYYEAVVRTTPVPGEPAATIDLSVDVTRGPLVSLSFEGDPLPETARRELVPVREEASVDEDLLEDSRARIVTYLQERGYWRARVDYVRRETPAGFDVVFTIARGRLYDVEGIVIGGAQAVSEPVLRERIELEVGEIFRPSALASSLDAMVQLYQNSGFPGVRIEQAIVDVSPPALSADVRAAVQVRLRVIEGMRAEVASVAFEGAQAISPETLTPLLTLRPGEAFSSAAVVASREAILRRYLDDGYRQAQIETRLDQPGAPGALGVTFVLTEGVQTIVDRIIVVGNVRTSEDTIRRELRIVSGQPFGLSRVFDSQRRLTALGLFRSVRITDVGQSTPGARDVIVTVEEAPVTTVGYGAGLEGGQRVRRVRNPTQETGTIETRFELAGRGFLEAGRRNLFGKNRSLSLFLRASVRPRDFPNDPARDGTGLGVSEYRVLGTWREPRAFLDAANLDISAFTEQAIRSSFNFRRQALRVDWSRLAGPSTTLIARYGYGRTELFDARVAPEDQLNVDRLFPQFRLSSITGSIIRDTRDDPLDPERGHFISVDGELATRSLGSEVGFTKTLLQGFLYRRLPARPRVVLAGGARLGLARGLPRALPRIGDDGQALEGPDGEPLVDVVRDLPASERFFAGGDSTVRGFTLDRLGEAATLDRNGLPTGGNALVVLNAEARVPVWRSLAAAVFLDAGNVFLRAADLDLSGVRGATGVGLRYASPIGPIRVDLGFKMDRQTFINGRREGRTALHITVGQAF